MKNELHALIAEQKALTAKFEELLKSNTEELTTLDPKKVYIKGHPTRGAEVIKMLEDLGGINKGWSEGIKDNVAYFINDKRDGDIDWLCIKDFRRIFGSYIELHLPEEVSEADPPTEEVELIEGEVYQGLYYVFIMKSYSNCGSDIKFSILAEYHKNKKGITFNTSTKVRKRDIAPATPDQRKQLFNALEKAGKHFDKENMRLIDVEEWSCEQGLPIIVRNETTNWRANIFIRYNGEDAKYPFSCATCDEEGHPYKYAIPYNYRNKYLIGTTNRPDKHYKFVEKQYAE